MNEPNDATYYEANREARLNYQKAYYRRNTERVKRKRELDSLLDPELIDKVKRYQQDYFKRNRDKILARRALNKKA